MAAKKTGRPSNKVYDSVNVFLNSGDLLSGKEIIDIIHKEYEDDITKVYKYSHKKDTYNIGQETAMLIKTNTRGITLSDIKCAHCKSTILMKFTTIRDKEGSTCPLCARNIYDISDKKVRRRVW